MFLPPDPAAGRGQGVARNLTAEEGFLVYLGAELVSRGIPAHAVKEMLPDIEDYFKKNGIFPIRGWVKSRQGDEQKPARNLQVVLGENEKFTLLVETVLEEKRLDEKTWQKTYFIDKIAGESVKNIKGLAFFSIKGELDMFCVLLKLK